MKLLCILLVLALTFIKGHNSTANYKNHKVVTFKIENEDQLKQMKKLETEPGVRKLCGLLNFDLILSNV
jgi:hypothetical protein